MFARIRRHWAEARADVAADDVEVLLNRFRRLDPNSCYFVISAFVEVQSSVEAQYGDARHWSDATRKKVVRHLWTGAHVGFKNREIGISREIEQLSSYGVALLGLYFEAQGLQGRRAEWMIERIEEWRRANRG